MKPNALLATVAPIALLALPASAQAQTANQQQKAEKSQKAEKQQKKKGAASGKTKLGQSTTRENVQTNLPGAPDTTPSQDRSNTGTQEIVVNGIRASLQSSEAIKRNSDAILDAITAEDIGKLPDDTAAESLARIAGVQITRFSDEANGVLIRGLPDVATSYNGREIFTAELRRVQLQDFPAQALAGIEVYKSGTADLIEAGLAGLINVRTRRPFDFKGRVIAGGIRGTYNDQSRKFDPIGNILVSDRFHTGLGEVGFLVNVTYAQSSYYNGVRYNGNIVDSGSGAVIAPSSPYKTAPFKLRFPTSVGLYNDGGKRYRPSGNFSFQLDPAPNLDLYFEGLYQGFRADTKIDTFNNDLRSGNPQLSDIVLVDGTQSQVKSLVKTGGMREDGYRSAGHRATNTYQLATGAKWHTGMATLSTDVAYTWSDYQRRDYNLDIALTGGQKAIVDFFDQGGASFSLPGFDASDASQYIGRGYYQALTHTHGSGWQWRTDLVLKTNSDFLHTLEFGFRYTNRDARLDSGSRYAYFENLKVPLANLPVGGLHLTPDPFRGSVQGFTRYLAPSENGVIDNTMQLQQFSINALQQLIKQYTGDPAHAQQLSDAKTQLANYQMDHIKTTGFHAHEDSYAAYAQGKFRFYLGSIEWDGVAGARLVNTVGTYSGTSQVTAANGTITQVPQNVNQNYVDVLPNVNFNIKLTHKLQLRLGYTFTRTRPDFGSLNPALTIQIIGQLNCTLPENVGKSQCDPTNPYAALRATGSGGNPNLKPLTSHNYDASLEYYFSKTGYASAAVFYRDLFGFINNYTRYTNVAGYGLSQISEPVNSGDGRIKGAELSIQSFLDFLPGPLKGIGVQANVTYLDGKNRIPVYNATTDTFTYGDFVQIIGLSKWTYNASVFYEKHGVSARLSYNRRSHWPTYYGTDIKGNQTMDFTTARERLDFSASYDITHNFTISAEATNLLAKPFNNYREDSNDYVFPIDVRDEGRYFGLGVRFRFGK